MYISVAMDGGRNEKLERRESHSSRLSLSFKDTWETYESMNSPSYGLNSRGGELQVTTSLKEKYSEFETVCLSHKAHTMHVNGPNEKLIEV